MSDQLEAAPPDAAPEEPAPHRSCLPPDAYPGQWWATWAVETVGGEDVYTGIAADCTEYRLAVPAGTPVGQVLGLPGSVAVPAKISVRQFLRGMADDGIITREEAKAAGRTGAVPAFVAKVFATFDPDTAFAAEMDWIAMYDVERSNPLLTMMGHMLGMDDAAMDAAFRRWGAIS